MVDGPQPEQSPRLLRHRDFLLLWGGQSISEAGSEVTVLALPLTAVVYAHASTFQVGLLSAAVTAAFLLIALPAGLVVDRVAKRPMMLTCDVARLVIIGSIPVAAALGALTMYQLYAVALLSGLATVFFDVAYQSYLPSLVGHGQLVDANGKLATTAEAARVGGPGLGGALVGLFGAPGAMAADAASFAASLGSLLLIRTREAAPARTVDPGKRGKLRSEITAGLRFVLGHPVLRKISACTASSNLFSSMAFALAIVFLVRVLHVTPAVTGLVMAGSALGGVLGGVLTAPLSRWIGSARIIWVSVLGFGPTAFLVPLARPGWGVLLFVVGWAGFAFSGVLYNVAQVSYRQSVCPPELLGRMNAAVRWIVWGTLPLGGILGGVLGSIIGIRATLWVAASGICLAGVWLLFSPLRRMRDIPPQGPTYLVPAPANPAEAAPSPQV
jgi:MFS family permease